jgi:hypothetical protein
VNLASLFDLKKEKELKNFILLILMLVVELNE